MVKQCPVHNRMFSNIPGFYPLDNSDILPKLQQPEISSDILGGQLQPRIENQCCRTRTLLCNHCRQPSEKLTILGCLLTFSSQSHYLGCLILSLYKDSVQVHALLIGSFGLSASETVTSICCGIDFLRTAGHATYRMSPLWICRIASSCSHLTWFSTLFPVKWTAGRT